MIFKDFSLKGWKLILFSVPFRFQQWTCNLNLGVFRKGGTARGRSQDTQSVLDVVFFCWLPWPSTASKILQHLDRSYHIQITTTQVILRN